MSYCRRLTALPVLYPTRFRRVALCCNRQALFLRSSVRWRIWYHFIYLGMSSQVSTTSRDCRRGHPTDEGRTEEMVATARTHREAGIIVRHWFVPNRSSMRHVLVLDEKALVLIVGTWGTESAGPFT